MLSTKQIKANIMYIYIVVVDNNNRIIGLLLIKKDQWCVVSGEWYLIGPFKYNKLCSHLIVM